MPSNSPDRARWRRGCRAAVCLPALARASAALALAVGALRTPADASDEARVAPAGAGAFSAQLILVPDARQLLAQWSGTRRESIDVDTVHAVAVGAEANAFVVFGGCSPDAAGRCDVTMRLRVQRPDGKLHATTPPLEVWQYKAPPPARTLQLSVQYLKMTVEPSDAPGRYVVSAEVKDHVSGSALRLATAFTATR
ncbi:MAG: hypothetical protein LKCHEGNO_01248 [Burkholderiaceae bacterium]|nr:hypothetical protein [Burkholderiaceae bacterium]